jgi:hypothetical protein
MASQYWNLLQQMHDVVAGSGMPYLIDLGNEGMPDPTASISWRQYVTNIWSWYVAKYGPDYTVGFSTPSADRISNPGMSAVYGATKPRVVDVHAYDDARTALTTADSALTSQGLSDIDIIVGETWYNDLASAQSIRWSIDNVLPSGRWVRWLAQWPRSQSGSQHETCTGQNVQSPLDNSAYFVNNF